MTNRSSSNKKHGMTKANKLRPKSIPSKRKNKMKANMRKETAIKELREALKGK